MAPKHRVACVVVAMVLAVMAPGPAAAQGSGNSCDVAGIWYSDGYIMTVTPIAAGRYQFTFKFGFDPLGASYSLVTDYVGEMSKTGARTFRAYSFNYSAWKNQEAADAAAAFWADLGVPVTIDAAFPERDLIRARIQLVDCNTLTNSIDLFWIHFPKTQGFKPFETAPPDIDVLALLQLETLDETYYRMSTSCPSCPPAPARKR